MRIAHVSVTYPPYAGGTGNVCHHNARELARRGHDVHVLTTRLPGSPGVETMDGVMVHRLRPALRLGNACLLPDLLAASKGFGLIHLHYPFIGGEAVALVAHWRRVPTVVTYHQDVVLEGALDLVARALFRSLGVLALRSASRVLFTSEDYGRASHARQLLRGLESRIGELPNGVDVDRFHPGGDGGALRRRLGLAPRARIALLVARLDRAHHFKGVEVFLKALSELPPDVVGVIVGDGDLRPGYESAAKASGLLPRVRFVGRVPDEDLPSYYHLADVTVLPSVTMGEAFGLVLLESMACATPVVASDLPGVRTVVEHGRDGLLAQVGDPSSLAATLAEILRDDAARREMGWMGRKKVVDRYDWRVIGGRLEDIYEQVLRGEISLHVSSRGAT